MTQFDIFHIFVENSVNSDLCFFCSNQPKSEIYPKMPMFEQLKKKVPVNSKNFLTKFRKILIWTFWDYKSSWSKKSTPIQARAVIGAPTMYFQKMQFLGVFRPFLQRSLDELSKSGEPKVVSVFFSILAKLGGGSEIYNSNEPFLSGQKGPFWVVLNLPSKS